MSLEVNPNASTSAGSTLPRIASTLSDPFSEILPYELQCEIFSLALIPGSFGCDLHDLSQPRTHVLVTITSVCRAWRRTALSCSKIWSEIDVSRPDFADLCYIRSITGSYNSLDLVLSMKGMDPAKRQKFMEELHTTRWTQFFIRLVVKNHASWIRRLEIQLPGPALQVILPCLSHHAASLGALRHLVLSGISPLSKLAASELSASLISSAIEEMDYLQFPADFLRLQAPELRSLELSHASFQRFTAPFLHLQTLILGPNIAFSNQSFVDFCSWLLELPHIQVLKITSSTHHDLETDDQVHLDSSPSTQRLRLHSIVVDEEPSYPRLFHLLDLLDPSDLFYNYLTLHITEEALGSSGPMTDSHVLRLVDSCLLSTPALLGVLSFSCEVNALGPPPGVKIAGWAGSPFMHFGWVCVDHSGDASKGPPAPSTELYITWQKPEEGERFRSSLQSLVTFFFFRTTSIPSLTHIYIHSPFFDFTYADWKSFFPRHPNLRKLQAQLDDVYPLFSALLNLQRMDGDRMETIMLCGSTIVSYPRVQDTSKPTATAWSTIKEYVHAKHRSGKPLRALSFELCAGLRREDLEPLRELVTDYILFTAALGSPDSDDEDGFDSEALYEAEMNGTGCQSGSSEWWSDSDSAWASDAGEGGSSGDDGGGSPGESESGDLEGGEAGGSDEGES